MKGYLAGWFFLLAPAVAFAQSPDPRDSVIIQSKLVNPGLAGSGVLTLKVEITNKDTLANFTLPVEIRSLLGGAFIVLGYPRTFNGTASRLTSTLGNSLVFSPLVNSASPDSAVWSAFWDPNDTMTVEPSNASRKPFWELKFDTVKAALGQVQIDSAVIFDNRVGFVSIGGNMVGVNFIRSVITVDVSSCNQIYNCLAAGGNVLFGRSYSFDFDADCPGGRWSLIYGPGAIDSITGIYSFSGQCGLGAVPVGVRHIADIGKLTECQFAINIIDNFSSCSPAQDTVSVSHGEMATNQINALDPDAGDGIVFSKLSGPGAVNASGAWSYQTSCSDVGASPQTVRIKTSDAFGSCNPGPGADTCEFQLIVTNAAPAVTNCPADVLPADTGVAFSLQLSGVDIDPGDAGNLSWFLVSGPAGFSVSPSGLVQWTPAGSQWGLRSATVQVRDLCGAFTNCQINFAVSVRKGDMNADGQLSPADLIHILNCIFQMTPPPVGSWACDLNCSGSNTQSDAVLLLNAVFLGAAFPC